MLLENKTVLLNELSNPPMEDVQGRSDTREINIDKVGIKAIKHPIGVINRDGSVQNTIATFSMYVNLPHNQKGTHMSRFIEALNSECNEINFQDFGLIAANMTRRLEADSGYIEVTFPFFLRKKAPVTGVESMLDYEVTFQGRWEHDISESVMKVITPVTSLCPCSKKISDYGAHNQRSHITITAKGEGFWVEDLIDLVEQEASCDIYGLLKRTDEKYVTEKAYNNPKFVEDIVRDIANDLNHDTKISYYKVEAENFESIHNHSAYAMIENKKERSGI